jgi:hypothetical protein
MAVTVGNTSSSSGTTSSLVWSHTSNSNYLTVAIAIYDDSVSISSVQWGSTSLSLVSGASATNPDTGSAAIYAGVVADSGTENITVALSGSAEVVAGGISWVGSSQAADNADTNVADNVTVSSINVDGAGENNYLLDVIISDKTPDVGVGQTELFQSDFSGAASGSCSYQDGVDGGGMGWGGMTNADVAHVALRIPVAASSPQSRTVTAASAEGDSKTVSRLPGQVGRSVAEAAASADARTVTILAETSRSVGAASADSDAPAVSVQPGVAARVVAAADAAGDAPQVTAAPGQVARSVSEATAAADAPAVSAIISEIREVAAAAADADAKAVSVQPGVAPRIVAAATADADAPQVTAFISGGVQSRSVVAASADAGAAAVSAVPGVAARSVLEASASASAPVASPSFVVLVTRASAWCKDQLVFPENLKYQHFNVRGQKRGYDEIPAIED